MDKTDQVTVTQEDREAYLSLNMLPEFDAYDVRLGRWDSVSGIQAFARHRIAAEQQATERERERCENAVAAIEIPPEGLGDKIDAWLKAINIGVEAIRQGETT